MYSCSMPTKEQVEIGREIAKELLELSMLKVHPGYSKQPLETLWIYSASRNKDLLKLYDTEVIDSVAAIYLAMKQAEEAPRTAYKPHEQRELVNAVCAIARGFHSHESLRDRMAHVLLPAFASEVICQEDSGPQEHAS